MPRPSSPLDAKASVRSPYALDRSQQNSCVGTVASARYETSRHAHTCALSLPDNDVFTQIPPPNEPAARRGNPSLHNVIDPHIPDRSVRGGGNLPSAIARGLRLLGGARRDRTDDLMLAKHALYQLSYGPSKPRSRLVRSSSSIRRLSAQGVTPGECGGPRQTRTADLTLIRRVL